MASFVETATLRLIDQVSAPAQAANRQLNMLFATAKKLQSLAGRPLAMDFRIKGLNQFQSAMTQIQRLQRLAAHNITPQINYSKLTAAEKRLDQFALKLQNLRKNSAVNLSVSGIPSGANSGALGRNGGAGSGHERGPGALIRSAVMAGADRAMFSMGEALTAGTRDVANANSRMAISGWSAADQKAIAADAAVQSAKYGGAFYIPHMMNTYSEIGSLVGNKIEPTKLLASRAFEVQSAQLDMGKTPEQAESGMRELFKSVDNMNAILDDKGNFNGDRFNKYMDVITQEMIRSGGFLTPQKINTAVTYARGARQSLDTEGLRNLLIAVETSGTQAGTSLASLVDNLTGHAKKENLENQAAAGLIHGEVTTSATGKPRFTYKETDNIEMLRADPLLWMDKIRDYIIKSEHIDANNKDAADAALRNPVIVQRYMDKLFGRRNARDLASMFITARAEFDTARVASKKINPGMAGAYLMKNPAAMLEGTLLNLKNVSGEAGNAILKNLVGPIMALNKGLIGIGQWVRAGDDKGASSMARGTLIAGLTGTTLLGIARGFGEILGGPQIKSAAAQLSAASGNLNSAAMRMSGAGAGGAPGSFASAQKKGWGSSVYRLANSTYGRAGMAYGAYAGAYGLDVARESLAQNGYGGAARWTGIGEFALQGAALGATFGPLGAAAGAAAGALVGLTQDSKLLSDTWAGIFGKRNKDNIFVGGLLGASEQSARISALLDKITESRRGAEIEMGQRLRNEAYKHPEYREIREQENWRDLIGGNASEAQLLRMLNRPESQSWWNASAENKTLLNKDLWDMAQSGELRNLPAALAEALKPRLEEVMKEHGKTLADARGFDQPMGIYDEMLRQITAPTRQLEEQLKEARAADKMQSAADKMDKAADKMNNIQPPSPQVVVAPAPAEPANVGANNNNAR